MVHTNAHFSAIPLPKAVFLHDPSMLRVAPSDAPQQSNVSHQRSGPLTLPSQDSGEASTTAWLMHGPDSSHLDAIAIGSSD